LRNDIRSIKKRIQNYIKKNRRRTKGTENITIAACSLFYGSSLKNIINLCPFFVGSGLIPLKIIALDNMKVRVAGTMQEIKEMNPAIIREWDAMIAKENAKEHQLR